jgi:carboxyl-terminal processing protease
MSSTPRSLTPVVTALLLSAAFLVGYFARDGQAGGPQPVWAALAAPAGLKSTLDDSISLRPVQLFQEALSKLEREYVDPIKAPEELTYAAIRGMLAELKDPYTRFMDPKEYKDFTSDNAGRFAGIGATLNMTEIPAQEVQSGTGTLPPIVCPVCATQITDTKHYRVSIVEPLPGSPAKAAGLLAGDFILKVNDVSTDGLSVGEVADKIRGPEGTKVTLTIARKEIAKPLSFTIVRAQIEVPATEHKVLEGNIGYLRLLTFNEKTVSETRAALQEFNKAGVRGVLLDLRNNPGGLLTECIKVASMFLPNDKKVIVSTQGRDGQRDAYTRTERQLYEKPLIVLANKGSASASEILSGALKDYERARIVGESTFGKALVQTVLRMSDGSAMAITTAHYYTPNGHDVGKVGVSPNVTVELDKSVKQLTEKDNQALEALRLLKLELAKATK